MTTSSKMKLSTDRVLKGLEELRNQKLLCDVHLVAEGAKFPAHRVVLAAASPYFQAMFTGGFKENQMNEITLNDTSSAGLKCVLDAIYTGELLLSEENVCAVLPLASLLQLNEIVKFCEGFFVTNVSGQNCLSFLSAAEKFDLQEALDVCNKFILENFDTVSKLAEFTNLSKEQLCYYISDDRLKTSHGEMDVYRATLKWFEANRSAKGTGDNSSDLADLMQHVRFPLIPNDLILEEIQHCPQNSENTQVRKMVTEAQRFHNKFFAQPLREGKQFQPRGERMLALIQPTEAQTKLHMIRVKGSKLFLDQFSEQDVDVNLKPSSICLLTKGNYLFLFGSEIPYNRAVGLRYDVRNGAWTNLKPPPFKAYLGMAGALLKDRLYLIGGMGLSQNVSLSQNAHNVSANVSQYSIETNSWLKLENLPTPLASHAAASHGNYVFCAGGSLHDSEVTNKLYAYDAVGKIWLTKASMNSKRFKFSMEGLGAKLVACGGLRSPHVEIYDIADDQWTLIQNCALSHHYCPASVVLNDKVYVIGGSGMNSQGTMSKTDFVSAVDVQNATVRKVSNIPFRVASHACALLTAPNTTFPRHTK